MKKPLSLLAVLLILGGLLFAGWRWMDSAPSGSSPLELSPEVIEAPEPEPAEEPRVVAPQRDRTSESEEPSPAPVEVPSPIFLARGVTGRVIDTSGTPVASARVTFRLLGSETRSSYGTTRSDETGRYAFGYDFASLVEEEVGGRTKLFERLARAEQTDDPRDPGTLLPEERSDLVSRLERPLVLQVTARASSDRRATRRLILSADPPALVHLDLLLEARTVFGGRVLAGWWGVEGIRVALFDREWQPIDSTTTDDRGRFVFDEPESGFFRVHARREGRGAAVISGTYPGGLSSGSLELELEGEATLHGRVVMPDGKPVCCVPLMGVRSDLVSPDPTKSEAPDLVALAQAEEAGGLAFSHSGTDELGYFRMSKMQEGRYALRFEDLGERYQPEGIFATGGRHEVIFRARLLQVRIIAPAEVTLRTRVHFEEVLAIEPPPGAPRRRRCLSPQRGQARLVVESGSTWRVWLECGEECSDEQLVYIGDGTYLEEITFTPDEWASHRYAVALAPLVPTRPAYLVVELADEKGEKHPLAVTLWRLERGGSIRLYDWLPREVGERLPGLTAGEYELTVRSIGEAGEMLLPVTGRETVHLAAGEERRVTVKAERGGRLAVKLATAEPRSEDAPEWPFRAMLTSSDRAASSIPLRFRAESPTARPSATLLAGRSATCEPALPAGRYTLQLLSHLHDPVLIPVVIETGETTLTEVELVERASDQKSP